MDLTSTQNGRGRSIASRILPKLELLTTGFYLLVGMFLYLGAESYLTDRIGSGRGRDAETSERLAAKGVAFVIGAGAVLFLVLRGVQNRRGSTGSVSISNAERLEWVARAVTDAMWDWDLRTNRVWRSEGYARLFGYGASELPGSIEAWIERLDSEDQDRVVTSLRLAVRSGQPAWSEAYGFRTKAGAFLEVMDRARVLRDDEGEPVRVIGGLQRVQSTPPPGPAAAVPLAATPLEGIEPDRKPARED